MSTTPAVEVERFVRHAARVGAALRAVEALCLGAFAALLCAAAARASGSPSSAPTWIAASIAGACAAASWLMEHARGLSSSVQAVDRRLALDGALVTAWRSASTPCPVGELLSARVARTLASRGRRAVARGTSLGWLAAPLVGAAALALAPEPRGTPDLAARARWDAAVAALASSGARLGDPRSAELAEPTTALVRDARAWLDRQSDDAPTPGGDGARDLLELETRARALAAGAPPNERAALTQLADATSELRRATSAGRPGARPAPGLDTARKQPGAGSSLTPSAPIGTMARSPSLDASAARPTAVEGGVAAVRWWPPAYDDLVARWSELDRPLHPPR